MTDQEILVLYKNNSISLLELRKLTGLSDYKIHQIAKRHGIELRGAKRTVTLVKMCPDADKLRRLAVTNMTNKEIAAEFCVSPSLLDKWFKSFDIDRRFRNNEGNRPAREELQQRYEEGRSCPDLALHYKVTAKTISNWLEYYGIEKRTLLQSRHTSQYKTKYKETCQKIYGADNPFQNKEVQERVRKSFVRNGDTKRSKGEEDCIKALNEFADLHLEPSRQFLNNGKELDGIDLEKRVAIEFCGLFWHSEKGGKTRDYHYDKWKQCKEQGIKLFTIFEDEWAINRDKICRYIYMNTGNSRRYIQARKTEFVEVPYHIARQFCIDTHMQNAANFRSAYGLVYDSDLVSLMTFGMHHRNNKSIVMNRYCGKFDVTIIGGPSKLMTNVSKLVGEDIVTWSDNRWSMGNVYAKMGCEFETELPPDYYWTDFVRKYNKQTRRKQNTGQPTELTEKEYNEGLGMSRIWDCGKIRWVYRNKKAPE